MSKHRKKDSQKMLPGDCLAKIRKAKGMTQEELATKAGLIQVQVSDYERGRSRMTSDTVILFAEILGCQADDLLGLKTIKKDKKETPRRILKRMQKIEELPKRDQQALFRTIDVYLKKAS